MSPTALRPLRQKPTSNYACLVREAGSGREGWITLHAHGEGDEDGAGTVHVYVGPNGRVSKGPRSLVGSAIGHLASHPSTKSAEHHPPGHEPPGARSHPQYAEHQPPDKPAPLPGKPYARLHGAPQTRQEQPKQGPEPLSKEQTHAGLQQAREQAKAAKAATPEAKAADAAAQSQQAGSPQIRKWQQEADKLRQEAADYRAQGLDSAARAKDAGARYWDGQIKAMREKALGKPYTPDLGRQAAGDPTHPWVTPQRKPAQDQAADAAVAHQQAQADLAAYRASRDRNPNPWAPHLSPPVNDARDKELAEKATRAQLAHQGVQAQQQHAAKPALAPLPAKATKPGEITKEHIQAKVMAGEHLTREEKGFVLNGYRMPKPKPEEPTDERRRTVRESAGPAPRFVVPILTAAR